MTTLFSLNLRRLMQNWHIILVPLTIIFTLLLLSSQSAKAEGSADFLIWPGKRLFLSIDEKQQLKVFAKKGEFLNVGASHVDVSGGTISVYSPSGVKIKTFDGKDGSTAIIFNDVQEKNGPTGGGSANGLGYRPGIIPITEEGIYTVTFDFPGYELKKFKNLEMQDKWTRAIDQPTIMRAILAYDLTISQNGAGNAAGSKMLKGRVYTNEHVSVVNENGNFVNPSYYILTKDGYQYYVDFVNVDPWGFPLSSNTVGLTKNDMKGAYRSMSADGFTRSADVLSWDPTKYYFYEPQAQDYGNVVNNKIFFNPPSTDLPSSATVTDIFRNNTHKTWLYSTPNVTPVFKNFSFVSAMAGIGNCKTNVAMVGKGGFIKFTTNSNDDIIFRVDMNANGNFYDAVDLAIPKKLTAGVDSVFWDGKLGNGVVAPAKPTFDFNMMIEVKGGEIHIMMFDIENNPGGIKFKRLNGAAAPDSTFYYDHSFVSGTVSGNAAAGNANPTTIPYTYTNGWGNLKMLDYWAYAKANNVINEKIKIEIVDDCNKVIPPTVPGIDTDKDGIANAVDLDDDNDGVSDIKEYCNGVGGGFTCLPGAKDPAGDEDKDGVPNYLDANDPKVPNNMLDANNDGKCDFINPLYDTDFDQVPDFLDLDSDNDGITDLAEAQHNQPDTNGDGVIDGTPNVFGINGLYDPIDSNPTSLFSGITYIVRDFDKDGVPDFDDLDSDNDGINDLAEQLYMDADLFGDGRLDYPANGNLIASQGLAPKIDPAKTGKAIPNPLDFDNDAVPDWHDFDSDNDGVFDVVEASRPDLDPDNNGMPGTGKPKVNSDGQVTDPTNPNIKSITDIEDTDKDGIPDFHDLDSDNDFLKDTYENDIPDPDNDGMIGTGKPVVNTYGVAPGSTGKPVDTDKDGKPDFRDLDSDDDTLPDVTECNSTPCIDLDKDGKPAFRDDDRDGDGLWDGYECTSKGVGCVDTDGDGAPDVDDLDSDNDTLLDAAECGNQTKNCADLDGDGLPNFRDIDRDGDGINDGYECTTKGLGCEDTDKDGIPDVDDLDSDNDGLPDSYECGKPNDCPDFDKDGIPDFRDIDSDNDGKLDKDECPTGAPCGDNDNDGFPNFRDISCDRLLDLPILTYQTPVCTGIINIDILQNFKNIDKIIWMNGLGDTLSVSSQKKLTISADHPDAISPYFVLITDKDGCRSPISEKAFIKANILPKDIKNAPVDDISEGKQNNLFNINVLANDVTDSKNEWILSIKTPPKNGTANIINSIIIYTPNKDYYGGDELEYSLCYRECPDICKSAKVTMMVKQDIKVVDPPKDIPCKVPNIITPNNDGANDFLKINCADENPNSELMIFNRWGLQVFKAQPYENNWFGTYGGDKLPAGTYYYIFKADRNKADCLMGYFTLLRD